MRQRERRLDKLKAAVDSALAQQQRPLEPGEESRPMFPLQAYVEEAGMREVWKTVGALRQRERPLANRFLGDVGLGDLLIELVAGLDHVPSWRELCGLLQQTADEQGEWIVAVPVANLIPPSGAEGGDAPRRDGVGGRPPAGEPRAVAGRPQPMGQAGPGSPAGPARHLVPRTLEVRP